MALCGDCTNPREDKELEYCVLWIPILASGRADEVSETMNFEQSVALLETISKYE